MKLLRLGIIVSVFVGILTVVNGVSAHANLVRSEPPTNSVLSQAPEEIHLFYTEPLEPAFSQASLRDSQGNVLDIAPSEVVGEGGKELSLHPGDLPDDVYTVSWRVISSTDGHLTQGTISFTIGAAGPGSSGPATITEPIPPDSAIVRWLNVLSLALLVGSVSFYVFVWLPVFQAEQIEIERRMRRLMWVGWAAAGLTTGLLLLSQVSVAANVSLLASLSSPALGQVIASTRFGELWLVRLALWLLFGIGLWLARQRRRFYGFAVLVGGLLLLTQSLFSHASGTPDVAASVAADWLHLAGVAFWVGGLAQFINVIAPVRRGFTTKTLGTLVAQFSNYARVAVVAVLVTGFYSAWLLVGTIQGLLTTVYGRALLVKGVLVLPLLGLAAVNLLLTQRQLRAGNDIWGARLRALVSGELALAVVVMGAVGIMTALAPARNIIAQRDATVYTPQPTPFYDSFYVEESQIHVDLEISPGWVGENTFKVTIYTHAGDPITDASLIRLRFKPQSGNLGESELRPVHQGDGVYVATGTNLSLPDDWRLRVMMERPGQYDTVVDFTPRIDKPVIPAPPDVNPAPPLQPRMMWLLLCGMALLVFGGMTASERGARWRRQARLLAVPLLIVGVALVFTGAQAALLLQTEGSAAVASGGTSSGKQETTLPNPIQPDAASIDAGHTLYVKNCVPCHGTEGKGDGPVGLTLNPRPANLTVHTAPGVHTDGQLFEWITNGFPGSAMPAWGQALSETDRWNLVNYIRTLAQPQ